MTYEVDFSNKSLKFLHKLSKTDVKLVTNLLGTIKEIKNNPHEYKKMMGRFKGTRREKHGDYRIIFEINKEDNIINILEIGKRNTIYRKK